MKSDFHASSRVVAYRKARKWLANQKGLRNIRYTEIAIGDAEKPSLTDADQWVVTIHYEAEKSAA